MLEALGTGHLEHPPYRMLLLYSLDVALESLWAKDVSWKWIEMAKNIYLLGSLWESLSKDQDPAVLGDVQEQQNTNLHFALSQEWELVQSFHSNFPYMFEMQTCWLVFALSLGNAVCVSISMMILLIHAFTY